MTTQPKMASIKCHDRAFVKSAGCRKHWAAYPFRFPAYVGRCWPDGPPFSCSIPYSGM